MGKYSSFVVPEGVNLRSDRQIAPQLLAEALTATVKFLQEIEPPDALLHKYDDWWEHDGLHFDAGHISLDKLLRAVETPQSLKSVMPGDFYVFVGVAPQTFLWYLRFLYDLDDDDRDEEGRFDLTLPSDLVTPYRRQVLAPLPLKVEEQEALAYYRSIGMDDNV